MNIIRTARIHYLVVNCVQTVWTQSHIATVVKVGVQAYTYALEEADSAQSCYICSYCFSFMPAMDCVCCVCMTDLCSLACYFSVQLENETAQMLVFYSAGPAFRGRCQTDEAPRRTAEVQGPVKSEGSCQEYVHHHGHTHPSTCCSCLSGYSAHVHTEHM